MEKELNYFEITLKLKELLYELENISSFEKLDLHMSKVKALIFNVPKLKINFVKKAKDIELAIKKGEYKKGLWY